MVLGKETTVSSRSQVTLKSERWVWRPLGWMQNRTSMWQKSLRLETRFNFLNTTLGKVTLLKFSIGVKCPRLFWKVKWPILHVITSSENIRVLPYLKTSNGCNIQKRTQSSCHGFQGLAWTWGCFLCDLILPQPTTPIILVFLLVMLSLLLPQDLCTYCSLCQNSSPTHLLNLASAHYLSLTSLKKASQNNHVR